MDFADMTSSPRTQDLVGRSLEVQYHAQHPWAALKPEDGLVIARGEGVYVQDIEGRRYLDALSGGWNVAMGFSCAPLVEAATRQLAQLPYYHTLYNRTTEISVLLSEALRDIAPFPVGKIAYSNSGSEAVETAVKLSWLYHASQGKPQKRKLLSRWGSVHGSTIFTSCLGGLGLHELFGSDSYLIHRLSSPNPAVSGLPGESEADFVARLLAELETLIAKEGADTIAAMVIEPIAVVEGFHRPPPGYLEGLREILTRHDIILVFDEVVSGFGRTGALFATDLLGVRPDMMVLGKGMTSGYAALAATLIAPRISAGIDAFCAEIGEFPHAMTTGMHPVAMAVALKVIELLKGEQGIAAHVSGLVPYFHERLGRLLSFSAVARVDGFGLGGSLHLKTSEELAAGSPSGDLAFDIAAACRHEGVLIHGQHGALIFAPPLISETADLDVLFDCLERVIARFDQR